MGSVTNIRFHNVARRAISIKQIDSNNPIDHGNGKEIEMTTLTAVALPRFPRRKAGILGWLADRSQMRRDLRTLSEMDDYRLTDIGLTREDVLDMQRNFPNSAPWRD